MRLDNTDEPLVMGRACGSDGWPERPCRELIKSGRRSGSYVRGDEATVATEGTETEHPGRLDAGTNVV